MDKLNFETPDLVAENVEKIGALFPSVVTEMRDENGNLKKGINFETLKQLLSQDVVDGEECYEFTWVGKKAAMAEAARPITKTLRPVKEDSRDWETTENLYIEGDNLEVLKILQESYLGKVKMIYIDPPYNTGKDFVYPDRFMMDDEEHKEKTNYFDEDGNINYSRVNNETDDRYHSNWCSMIYSRLVIARNCLQECGVIFISVDDHEQENLKKICDEVFGTKNFVAQLIWERAYAPKNDAKYISNSHDYVIMYCKNIDEFVIGRLPRTEEADARYKNPDNDPRGVWQSDNMTVKTYSPSGDYPITTPSGRVVEPPAGRCWRLSKNAFLERLQDNRIWFGADGNGVPRIKRFLSELKNDGMAPTSIMFYKEVGHSQDGAKETTKLLDASVFDGPKPVKLLRRLLVLANLSIDDIILDFFSGSATTAHAVMQLNAEDGGHRKFIMVQLPEPCGEKTEACKAGYKNICEIGKERIRRAGDKIKSEHPDADLDIGFRVFRVDESNMKDVYYHPEAVRQQDLFEQVSNIKEDRTDMDLLYACLLDWGVEIHLPHTQEVVDGCTVHDVDGGALMACFDEKVPVAVVEHMAQKQPLRVVFRDSAFASDAEKINVSEIFKNLSPDTKVKVL